MPQSTQRVLSHTMLQYPAANACLLLLLLFLPHHLLFGAPLQVPHPTGCDAIGQLHLPDTTITTAERVSSGVVEGPSIESPLRGLPVFCRVTGVLRPTADSQIHFEVWMPEKDWNGRFLGVGNGGFAGSIGYRELAGNLSRGFATAGSDTGHAADAEDASWAFGHPEKIKDFGWRAVHLTAERAKDVIEVYYGRAPGKSYFDSCSDGGREALMEAQRFPEDYDGILAGAPANAWTRMMSAGVDLTQETTRDPRAYISSLKLPAIEQVALAQCDALDGVKDGIISDPAKCDFRPGILLCKGADSPLCLTQLQVNALKKIYEGGADEQKNSVFLGLAMGDETGWREWVVGRAPGAAAGVQYAQNYFRYMVTGDAVWDILAANVGGSLKKATRETAADLDATDPDLSRFSARGGKLILYHGWDDPAISPWNSIAYYESVRKRMGAEEADLFLRLYMAPGLEHCVGGPGPDSFGQLGLPTTGGPKYGVFDALVEWVENGAPAGKVIATKYSAAGQVTMTRPLCPYPSIQKYKGTGDPSDAASFECGKE